MARTTQTRVKVKRAELLKIVDGRLHKMENDHKRAKETYPAKCAEWEAKTVAAFEKLVADAKRGKFPALQYGHPVIPGFASKPEPPSLSREICGLQRLQRTLQIAADDVISLHPDDTDAYFGPCPVR